MSYDWTSNQTDITTLYIDIHDVLGTNFPPELYDGHLFGKESYYDELSKSQRAEMDKREKVIIDLIIEEKRPNLLRPVLL